VKRPGKLDMHTIYESVLMPFTQNYIFKMGPCLSKLQLAEVGSFIWEAVCCLDRDCCPSSLERHSFHSLLRSILEENHRLLCRTSGL